MVVMAPGRATASFSINNPRKWISVNTDTGRSQLRPAGILKVAIHWARVVDCHYCGRQTFSLVLVALVSTGFILRVRAYL